MTCQHCGKIFYGRKRKYCPECAPAVYAEQQKKWRIANGYCEPRHCVDCGKIVGMCEVRCRTCKAEHLRNYMREAQRRHRARKKIMRS